MDNNSVSFYESDGDKRRKRGNAFSTVVILIVLLLLALMIVGLFWPDVLGVRVPQQETAAFDGEKAPAPQATPMPAQPETDAPEKSEPPAAEPTAEPAPAAPAPTTAPEDRKLPSFDGALPELIAGGENPIPDIYEAVSPGVVGVLNYQKGSDYGLASDELQLVGSGSGFIVSSDGYVLTNAHVVEKAEQVTILTEDGEEIEATVAGADAETDIAVLKVEKSGMHALVLGDSDAVRVGEFVLAIGNPLSTRSLTNTLTYGIISAKDREITIDTYTNIYLQTDAAINFGNSGGPLLNIAGEVIGINSAKTVSAGYDAYGNTLTAEGIGFALPINQVKKVMETLILRGYVERPGIGVVVSTVTEALSEAENLPVGALVESVVRGGPAEAAGVQKNDIIVEANGVKIKEHVELVDGVEGLMLGDELHITVYRAGEYVELTIVIANKSTMDFDDVDE